VKSHDSVKVIHPSESTVLRGEQDREPREL